ncbi:DNA-binding protein [Mesorhizobium sp. M1329]|uniref:DNA-binding protein n=1 Tax=Mesorhizobium sp. M1329 TaxID=2957083 RepID=UPI00333591ED
MADSQKKAESQVDKFREAARELETDQSEEAFDRVLKKVAKAPPQKEEKPKKASKPG